MLSRIALILLGVSILMRPQVEAGVTPDAALQRLIEGNRRFVKDELIHPDRTLDRRLASAQRQKPFAIILGCSDSRVSPEILFDEGIGDLFVIRVAGNVLGPLELDSIDYSVIVNESSLIVVLGHENCGAIQAVLSGNTADVQAIAALITPNIACAKDQPGNLIENAVKENVRAVQQQLEKSRVVSQYIKEKKVRVVGGYYNLTTGHVDFLTPAPPCDQGNKKQDQKDHK